MGISSEKPERWLAGEPKPYTSEEAHEEAAQLRKKVEAGEASDYPSAETPLAVENFERALNDLEDRIDNVDLDIFHNTLHNAEKWLVDIPYAKAQELTEQLMHVFESVVPKDERDIAATYAKDYFPGDAAKIFFDKKVTPEYIETFFASSMEQYISPRAILLQMGRLGANAEVVRKLLARYQAQMEIRDFAHSGLFGDHGLLNPLDKEEKSTILMGVLDELHIGLDEKLRTLLSPTEEGDRGELKHREQMYWKTFNVLWHLATAIQLMEGAAHQQVVLPDYQARLTKIREVFDSLDPSSMNEMWQNFPNKIENLKSLCDYLLKVEARKS